MTRTTVHGVESLRRIVWRTMMLLTVVLSSIAVFRASESHAFVVPSPGIFSVGRRPDVHGSRSHRVAVVVNSSPVPSQQQQQQTDSSITDNSPVTERPPFNADRGPFRPGSSSRPSATGTQQQPRNDRKYTSPSRDGMPPRGPRPGSSSSPYQQQQQQAPGRGGGRSSNRGGPPGGGGRGGGGGERRSYSSFPQQQQQQRGDGNRSFRSGPPFAADGGGGGSNLQQLKLVNPMRISRMVDSSSSDSDPRRRSDDPSSRGRGPRPVASAAGSAGGDTTTTVGTGGKDFGRKQKPASKKAGASPREGSDDDRNNRKTSLRIGTSRKGRGAELSSRRGSLKKKDRSFIKAARAEAALERRTVYLPEGALTVSELADLIEEKPIGLIKFLMTDLGIMASMTRSLDPQTIVAVVEGFGLVVGGDDDEDAEDEEYDEESAMNTGFALDDSDDPEDLVVRAPVVTIMGHVDHGKTSLLDAIRSTDVTSREAGGITQHIAAYQVMHKGNPITFIDTPGHAAFTDMRERGANITDMVILVVAADDGVKQQTADSIACARQAGVPLIVAINKCDLETADPVKVQTELTSYDILTEDFGGEVLSSQISAKKKTNLDDLLDKIMLLAEVEDLKANPNRDGEGIVVEANIVKGLGTVATTLVKRGTLRIGDIFVAGETYGKVRALISTTDNSRMKSAGPSTPVRVAGFEGVPQAGDVIIVVPDESTARELAENRQRLAREASSSSYQAGLMSSVSLAMGARKANKEMCVVVKADVQGSAEALARALRELRLENEEAIVTVKVLVSETGEVSKSDIAIASVTKDTTVIAFNVAASTAAADDARAASVPISYFNIIYDAIESVESRMQEVLSPTPDGEYSGSAVVQEVFNIGGTGNIAGSRCTDGILKKGANVRVMRGDKIMKESKIKTLRNFKAETDTIEEGNECGIGLVDFEDFQAGDVVECFVVR